MKIQKWGNSAAVRLPAVLLSKLNRQVGQKVSATVVDGVLVITPVQKRRYMLAELVAERDTQAERDADVAQWQNIAPVGKEVW